MALNTYHGKCGAAEGAAAHWGRLGAAEGGAGGAGAAEKTENDLQNP